MDEYSNIIIELENGDKKDFSILAIFEVGGCSYVALLPTQDTEDELIFYGCNEDTVNKELELIPIEDDEEFSIVSEAFLSLLNNYSNE